MPVFVDTNVLVYARDASEGDKQLRAVEWLRSLAERREGRLSLQVLNEYYVTVTRKLNPGLGREDARADVRDLLSWDPIAPHGGVIAGAWALEDRYGLSFWDALIVAAARLSGCDRLLTEDLQDGLELDGLLVVDPFAHTP